MGKTSPCSLILKPSRNNLLFRGEVLELPLSHEQQVSHRYISLLNYQVLSIIPVRSKSLSFKANQPVSGGSSHWGPGRRRRNEHGNTTSLHYPLPPHSPPPGEPPAKQGTTTHSGSRKPTPTCNADRAPASVLLKKGVRL
jgi:hypothetical protein